MTKSRSLVTMCRSIELGSTLGPLRRTAAGPTGLALLVFWGSAQSREFDVRAQVRPDGLRGEGGMDVAEISSKVDRRWTEPSCAEPAKLIDQADWGN